MIWAMSGGAAFLAIITNAFMGIFLKPMQKKLEGRIIRLEDRVIARYKNHHLHHSQSAEDTIQEIKQKRRYKAPKAYPPKHRMKPREISARKVTRLTKGKHKPLNSYQKSA